MLFSPYTKTQTLRYIEGPLYLMHSWIIIIPTYNLRNTPQII